MVDDQRAGGLVPERVRRNAPLLRELGIADGIEFLRDDVVDIDPELQIERMSYRCHNEITYSAKRHQRILFALRLHGRGRNSINGGHLLGGWRVQFRAHASSLKGRHRSITTEPPGAECRIVYLRMARPMFGALAADLNVPLPFGKDGSFHLYGALPTDAADAAAEVLDCPLRGRSLELFMRGKGLELAVLCVIALRALKAKPINPAIVGRGDIDRIRLAHEQMRQNPGQRYSLHALAKRVGTNVNKLEAGFHLQYGMTVFETLRTLRMERAAELMRSSEHKIGQIARLVGFSSAAQFTIAFRQRYQISPRDFRRQMIASGDKDG